MEVHSHSLETLGVNKEADKAYNPELKDILAPPLSQIPAGEDFTVPLSAHLPDVSVNDVAAIHSDGLEVNAASITTFSFPPPASDINGAPDINFQSFESGEALQNSQHEFYQQDEVFDDMVILENDMVTSASLSGGTEVLEVTDIQMDPLHQDPVSDADGSPVAVASASVEVNVAEVLEHPSGVEAVPVSVTVTDVTVVSTAVQEVPVVLTEAAAVEVRNDFPALDDGGLPAAPNVVGDLETKEPEVNDSAEPVEPIVLADGDASHVVTDEEIEAIKGQKVLRKFGRQYYGGEVTGFDPETKWFKVVYEDNDEEDLELWEVKKILASSENALSSKKRPRVDVDTDGSSQKSPKKAKKRGVESTAKKSSSGPKSAAKSPKTPGTKAKDSKSAKKSSVSNRAKSPGKLIKKALNSSAFKTPLSIKDSKGKGKEKTGTLTPKGGSTKRSESGKVSRSLNLQTPKSQRKGKASAGSSSSKKVTKSSGSKRKAEHGGTSSGKSKRPKKAASEAAEGDTGLVGKQVKKDFDGALYDGVVVKFDKKTQFYKVKYVDGDQEDLELHELKPILVQNLEKTEEKVDKPAKLSSLSSLMSARKASGSNKKK